VPAKKRLFIGLSIASILFIFGLGALVLYLVSHRENIVNRVSLYVLGIVLGVLILVVIFGVAGIVLTIWSARGIPPLQGFIRITTNLLFPLALNLGKWMGYGHEVIRGSFIEVNNQMVRTKKIIVPADKILVLTPHCLQRVECPHKITIDVENCKECGLCPVKGLIELCRHYRVKLAVATGGTFARRFVETHRPWAIVAVACELDLASGIQDTNPLPVLGVLNRRPHGPCRNTEIDLDKVEEAVCFFLGRADTDRVAEKIADASARVIRLEVVPRKPSEKPDANTAPA
jgi:hypothetical protein